MAVTPNSQTEQRRFLSLIWREKFQSQQRRGQLTLRKLTWVIALLAVGSAKVPWATDTELLLYLVPVVAMVFDMYIIGESFGIRRFATHVRAEYPDWPDGRWEKWVRDHRDPYSGSALTLGSGVILIASLLVLHHRGASAGVLGVWAAVLLVVGAGVHLSIRKAMARLEPTNAA